MRTGIIKNQIFLGIPWKNIKGKYEKARKELTRQYPLSFVIIGRSENQDAEDLLNEIEEKISTSDYAIFDATNGNPNVSLEFGYAEGAAIKRKLYICKHTNVQALKKEKPIISDLGGKKYSSYTTQDKLVNLLESFAKSHDYTKRFERFLKKQTNQYERKKLKTISLSIIHTFDEKESLRKSEIVQSIQDEYPDKYTEKEILRTITKLKDNKLLRCAGGGPSPYYWISEKG
jgi:hypothetical protein